MGPAGGHASASSIARLESQKNSLWRPPVLDYMIY